jgi:putative ABC transport system permease protein
MWLRGLVMRRPGRVLATAAGVAVSVALLASIGSFLSASKATMTRRAAARVPVDWQVEAQPGSDPAAVLTTTKSTPGVTAALRVGYANTTGSTATTGGAVSTVGPGVALGIPDGYVATFPGEVRSLTGPTQGVLLAQQAAADLHVAPGEVVTIGRTGLDPVPVHVDGVVALPEANSLFQKVGVPASAQPQAPPDNVILLPDPLWHQIFDPLAQSRPDLVRTQVHARVSHALPSDPAAAFNDVTSRAHSLEARLAGSGFVGDNLAATLDAARSDALYAQGLFLFLGLPGAVLAALLTLAVAGSGAERRRREQALLRTRGATTRQLVTLGLVEAAVVGGLGALVGLGEAGAVGDVVFGTASFGASTAAAVAWGAGAALAGLVVAGLAVAVPAWRDARETTVTEARRVVGRAPAPPWFRSGLDFVLLGASGIVFWLTGRHGYQLVLAPEGTPAISVSYWALAGPALFWGGIGLLIWRIAYVVLERGRGAVQRAARPVSGPLSGTVAASMSRQRRLLARSLALVALTATFAVATAVFNETYRAQADVDARLTNGGDVTVTQAPGTDIGPEGGARLARIPGVRHVEPIQHRFAYVGADLQDLYGVRTTTIVDATKLQNAYFQGGTARDLIGRLARQPDGILVSAETVRDFKLHRGSRITLRLQDSRTQAFKPVSFRYLGIAKEFPTAPTDSLLVANAGYVAHQTGNAAVGAFLIDTGGASPKAVAARVRAAVGTDATVTDITTSRRIVGSSLTAVDLSGLTRVELGFALVLAAGSTGLVLGLGLAERRRTFAIAAALGARRRQLGGFVWTEAAFVTVGGLLLGGFAGWGLAGMLVKVLTDVFDPPPDTMAVPWDYLAAVVAVAVVAVTAASLAVIRRATRPGISVMRELSP